MNLKSIKGFTIGLIAGMTIISTGSTYANTLSLEKIQAYLNYDLMITYNGKAALLGNTPITYNGKTYLPLTDIGVLTNMNVKYNQKERSVEMTDKKVDRSPLYLPDKEVEKYGFNEVYIIDNKEYVNFGDLMPTIESYGLAFKPHLDTQTISLLDKNGNVLIETIDTEKVRNKLTIEYQYFLNELLTLGKKE